MWGTGRNPNHGPAHKNESKSVVLQHTGTTSTQAHMTAGWKVTESDDPTKNRRGERLKIKQGWNV